MRLLHTSTLKLHEFFDDQIPFYVILSHTWGNDEVTLQDLEKEESKNRAGYAKITGCCALALSSGWEWVWIDTCCIDKTSSADLSEAINSMYRWYRDSQVCYAYLTDCFLHSDGISDADFCQSRWFTRGWTLQELLAPGTVIFYDRDWREVGTKSSLTPQISRATGISSDHIADPQSATIAAKMSWASGRQTSRVEDMAYSLLGLFELTMPLLYGEGNNAFKRLQHEIIAAWSDDESIYAWRHDGPGPSGMLAQSPVAFADSGDIINLVYLDQYNQSPSVKGKLVVVMNGILPVRSPTEGCKTSSVTLNCARQANLSKPLGIRLNKGFQDRYLRADPGTLLECEYPRHAKEATPPGFYNSSLEIWLDYPYFPKPYLTPHHFHVPLPLLNEGFRLSDEFLSDCGRLWRYDGCWQATIVNARDVRVMMFIGDTGGKFSLILAVRDNLPSVDVVVPRETETWSLEEIAARYRDVYYGITRGADELSKPLQGKNHVFVTLRKKLLKGKIVNVVDVSIRQEEATTREGIARVGRNWCL